MLGMHLDHISYAVGADGLVGTAQRLTELLGEKFVDGGVHPRFGTRNVVLPLVGDQYLEIVEVLDHPASDKAPFGQAVRDRSEAGGGWLGWVVAVEDIAEVEERLGRDSVPGNRYRPDGIELRWRQIGIKGLISDPQLPFFVQWQSELRHHPSAGASGDIGLAKLEIAGDPKRVTKWLGGEPPHRILEGLDVEWVAPHGTPGVVAAHFQTADGVVRI
jgi:glyoxalase-like protein